MTELIVRPMRPDDLATAERLSGEAFLALDRHARLPGDPAPEDRDERARAAWLTRAGLYLHTDPGGCWVAERPDEKMIGMATSYRRDLTWVLATYAVRPGFQGGGIGKALLEAAMTHSRGCLRGMLAASADPRAVRRYRLAGFSLHPQMELTGVVDRSALPDPRGSLRHVREGTPGDRDLLDSLDRRRRDAARGWVVGGVRGSDHDVLQRLSRLVVLDRPAGSGYAYLAPNGVPVLLAATDRRTAAALLWTGLAAAPVDEPVTLRHVTAANEWAMDVGLAARLAVRTSGYLALRGMRPPTPYLHHGTFL